MNPPSATAAWQVGPVSTSARIAAAALALLVAASPITWPAAPGPLGALSFTVIPVLVGIRVIRGFTGSLVAASATFLLAGSIAVRSLSQLHGQPSVARTVALVIATLVSGVGLAAVAAHTLGTLRTSRTLPTLRSSEAKALTIVVGATVRRSR